MDLGTLIFGGVLAYGILLFGLAIAVQPARRRLFALGAKMIGDPKFSAGDRNEIRAFLVIATSFWVGFLLPIAALTVVLDVLLGRYKAPPSRTLTDAPMMGEFLKLHALSVTAANPIMILASVPMLFVAGVVLIVADIVNGHIDHGRSAVFDAAESTVLRASTRFRQAAC